MAYEMKIIHDAPLGLSHGVKGKEHANFWFVKECKFSSHSLVLTNEKGMHEL
jgi:hypothetical protein